MKNGSDLWDNLIYCSNSYIVDILLKSSGSESNMFLGMKLEYYDINSQCNTGKGNLFGKFENFRVMYRGSEIEFTILFYRPNNG